MLKCINYLSDVNLIANVHSGREINVFIKVSNCEHCSLAIRSGVVPTVTTPASTAVFAIYMQTSVPNCQF